MISYGGGHLKRQWAGHSSPGTHLPGERGAYDLNLFARAFPCAFPARRSEEILEVEGENGHGHGFVFPVRDPLPL